MAKIDGWRFWRRYVTVVPDRRDRTLADIDTNLIRDLFRRRGAILFRGFDLDTDGFAAFVRRFCTHSVFNESGGRDTIDAEQRIQTVNLGAKAFPLHPELSREPWKPDVCFFGCLVPPKSGGETVICDGVDIVRKLPVKLREKLLTMRLRYTRTATPEELRYWLRTDDPSDAALANPPSDCPFTFERKDGHVLRSFTAPFLHKPMFTDDPAFGNFLLFSRYHNNNHTFPVFADGTTVSNELVAVIKTIGDSLTTPLQWQENDLVMLDNTRFLHGRREILNTDERYIMTYFGYLDFAIPSVEEGPRPRWRIPEEWRDLDIAA